MIRVYTRSGNDLPEKRNMVSSKEDSWGKNEIDGVY